MNLTMWLMFVLPIIGAGVFYHFNRNNVIVSTDTAEETFKTNKDRGIQLPGANRP